MESSKEVVGDSTVDIHDNSECGSGLSVVVVNGRGSAVVRDAFRVLGYGIDEVG